MSKQNQIAITQLSSLDLIVYDVEEPHNYVLEQLLKAAHVQPKSVTKMQLTEAILELVNADLGVTIMANWSVSAALTNMNIRAIPLTGCSAQPTWYAVWQPSHDQIMHQFLAYAQQGLLTGDTSVGYNQ